MSAVDLLSTESASVPRSLAKPRRPLAREFIRFFQTPKGLLLVALLLLAGIASTNVELPRVAAHLGSAMLVAMVLDVCLTLWARDEWIFPSGALLTGLILGLVLSPLAPPAIVALASANAIASKHLLRTRWSNVFNPAAFALVLSYFAFGAQESWWGALPDVSPLLLVVLIATGVYIAARVNKLPMVLAFLAAYFGLFTAGALAFDPSKVAEIFRAPDVNAALFLALFMLDDPPTSPVRYGDQVIFGLIAAVASCAAFVLIGAVWFLPAGVLVANGWESVRRVRERSAKVRSGSA